MHHLKVSQLTLKPQVSAGTAAHPRIHDSWSSKLCQRDLDPSVTSGNTVTAIPTITAAAESNAQRQIVEQVSRGNYKDLLEPVGLQQRTIRVSLK